MDSKPGRDNSGCNTDCHPGFYRLIEGICPEFDQLWRLNEILDYRLGQTKLAELYCYALEIGVPEGQQIDQFDEVKWHHSLLEEKHRGSKVAIDLLEKWKTIKGWMIRLDIFDPPRSGQGFDFSKPEAYLAARLAETPMSTEQIHKKLEDLAQCMYSLPNSYSDIF